MTYYEPGQHPSYYKKPNIKQTQLEIYYILMGVKYKLEKEEEDIENKENLKTIITSEEYYKSKEI